MDDYSEQNAAEKRNVYLDLRTSGVYEEDKKFGGEAHAESHFNNLVQVSSMERLCDSDSGSLNFPLGAYRDFDRDVTPGSCEPYDNRTSLTYEAPPHTDENSQNIYAEIGRKTSDTNPVNERDVTPPDVPPTQYTPTSVVSLNSSISSTPMKRTNKRQCLHSHRLLMSVTIVILLVTAAFGFGVYVGNSLIQGTAYIIGKFVEPMEYPSYINC